MRFLNTETLRFEHVLDSELHLEENRYAILSHRWGPQEEEVSFEDILSFADISHKKGFEKLKVFCTVASSESCRYGWINTCCIDKRDSVELAEAINSMYQWYRNSKICVVYLEDVPQKQLTDSEWFDKGWTLQELIAPKEVSFFDHDWNFLGKKTDILPGLSQTTKIPEGILNHASELSSCSVAQRMSWAANRTTTRVEDKAYSLMGLFDVNMPMIYGEREKAFLRLQQHIIQKSKDESIFAWNMDFPGSIRAYSGLYAPSPLAYARCSEIIKTDGSRGFSENNGELLIWSKISRRSEGTYIAVLNGNDKTYPYSRIFILIGSISMEGEYFRVRDTRNIGQGLIPAENLTPFQEQQIGVQVDPIKPPVNDILNGFWLWTLRPPGHHQCQTTTLSKCQNHEAGHIFHGGYNKGVTGVVHSDPVHSSDHCGWSKIHWIILGFDKGMNPVLMLANNELSQDPRSGDSQKLQSESGQAMVTRTGSQGFTNLTNLFSGYDGSNPVVGWRTGEEGAWREGNFPRLKESRPWPGGCLMMVVDRKQGVRGRVIKSLNLRVSIDLQPRHDPVVISTKNISNKSPTLNPLSEWVVDITDAGAPCPEEIHGKLWEDHKRRREEARLNLARKWIRSIRESFLYPYARLRGRSQPQIRSDTGSSVS